jgi:hypothetical protein
MTTTETVFDGAKAEAFGGHIMSILKGSLLGSMVDIGHRTGLFAAAAEGWATSEQLAARARLCERYVREWLGAPIAGLAAMLRNHSTKRGALGPVKPTEGHLGLPTDFLIAPDGRITALKYGRHAYDQWTVDELLDHARPVSA